MHAAVGESGREAGHITRTEILLVLLLVVLGTLYLLRVSPAQALHRQTLQRHAGLSMPMPISIPIPITMLLPLPGVHPRR